MKSSKTFSAGGMLLLMIVLLNVIILRNGFMNDSWYWGLLLTIPLLPCAVMAIRQNKHTGIRNTQTN